MSDIQALDTTRVGAPGRLRFDLRNYSLLVVVGVVFGVFQVLTDGVFLSQRNLGLLAMQTTIVGLASISAVMLIVTRNFDLSVGSAVALVGVVLASLTVKAGWNPWLAVVASVAAGLVLGLWNATWVAKIGVSSFIVTLAGMMIFRGVSLIATDGASVAPLPATLTDLAAGYLGTAPAVGVIVATLVAYTAVTVTSSKTRATLRSRRRLADIDVVVDPRHRRRWSCHLRVPRRRDPLPVAPPRSARTARRSGDAPDPLRRTASTPSAATPRPLDYRASRCAGSSSSTSSSPGSSTASRVSL